MIAIVCPECRGDTLWRYPHFQWAKTHVPGLPPRCYASTDNGRMLGYASCPDPSAHVEAFRARQRGTK